MYKIQLKQPALIERYEFSKNSNPILRNFYKKSTINKKIFMRLFNLFLLFDAAIAVFLSEAKTSENVQTSKI